MTDEGDQGGRVTVKTNHTIGADDILLSNGNKNALLYLLFWQGNAGEMIQTHFLEKPSQAGLFLFESKRLQFCLAAVEKDERQAGEESCSYG